MSTPTNASPYKASEKIYHRRSLLGRLWRRPLLLAALVAATAALGALAAHQYLGILGVLPQQRQARRAGEALARLIAQPEFTEVVVLPIERDLGATARSIPSVQALLLHIRREQPVAADFHAQYRRPPNDPSQTVRAWRDIVDRLRADGFDPYAYPQLAARGDRLLRDTVSERLIRFDSLVRRYIQAETARRAATMPPGQRQDYERRQAARISDLVELHRQFMRGTNPADYASSTGPLDDAQRAVVRGLHVTRTELDLFMYLDKTARDMANDDAGA